MYCWYKGRVSKDPRCQYIVLCVQSNELLKVETSLKHVRNFIQFNYSLLIPRLGKLLSCSGWQDVKKKKTHSPLIIWLWGCACAPPFPSHLVAFGNSRCYNNLPLSNIFPSAWWRRRFAPLKLVHRVSRGLLAWLLRRYRTPIDYTPIDLCVIVNSVARSLCDVPDNTTRPEHLSFTNPPPPLTPSCGGAGTNALHV